MKFRKNNQSGFTLTEILIALAIVAIMGSVVVANLIGNKDKAMIEKLKNDLAVMSQALEQYSDDNGFYPTNEQGLMALLKRPTNDPIPTSYPRGGYLSGNKVPKDPWKREYMYQFPGRNGEYDLFTYGKDKRPGGRGENMDIGTWNVEDIDFNEQNQQ